MNILVNQFELALCHGLLKFSNTLGRDIGSQNITEKIVALHVRLRVSKEQALNRELFISK
jgi:hypothetical protein